MKGYLLPPPGEVSGTSFYVLNHVTTIINRESTIGKIDKTFAYNTLRRNDENLR